MSFDPVSESLTEDDRQIAALAYAAGFISFFLAPLIIFLKKKDKSKFIVFHSLQATLFQSVIIAVVFLLSNSLMDHVVFPIVIVMLVSLTFSVIGALASYHGKWYEIPLAGKCALQFVNITD